MRPDGGAESLKELLDAADRAEKIKPPSLAAIRGAAISRLLGVLAEASPARNGRPATYYCTGGVHEAVEQAKAALQATETRGGAME